MKSCNNKVFELPVTIKRMLLLSLFFAFMFMPALSFSATGNGNGNGNGNNGAAQTLVIKSIAILPLENLTVDRVAAFIIKENIKTELKGKGWVFIVKDDLVEDFLAKRRIRYTGAITRLAVREMGKALGVDAVLVGSVNQYSGDNGKITVGIGLRLLSAVNGSILWSDNITYTGRDFEGFLGLGVVTSIDELTSMVVRDIVQGVADRFFVRDVASSPFEIERVIIHPTIGNREGRRNIRVKVVPIGEAPSEVSAVLGGEEIILTNVGDDEYEGSVLTPAEEGAYLLDIILTDKMMVPYVFEAAGSMVVDSIPPKIGVKVEHRVFASKKRGMVILEPRLMSYDDVEGWRIEVKDGIGNIVRSERGFGGIPRKLAWKGEGDKYGYVVDGNYTVNLAVRDVAGNETVVSEVVRVKNSPPVVSVNVDVLDGMLFFSFSHDPEESLKKWRILISDREGNTLKSLAGDGGDIPNKVEYPIGPNVDMKSLRFTVFAEDTAGNTSELTKTVPSLFAKSVPFAKLRDKSGFLEDF